MDNGKKKLLLLGILLLGCVATSVFSEYGGSSQSNNLLAQHKQQLPEKNNAAAKTILVYVNGAVLEPGLYNLPADARVLQAITAAGGMTAEAQTDKVNLAKKLKDGNQVYVPYLKTQKQGSATKKTAGTAKQQSGGSAKLQEGQKIKLNTATAEELDLLPGIGKAMAQRIIEQRRQQRFTRVEDLLKVKGIGKVKLEKLKNLVEVD